MSDTRETIADYWKRLGLKFELTRTSKNPHMDTSEDWNRSASHWRFTLSREGRRMSGYFSQGSAHTKPPTFEEVLNCLASDAAGERNAQSFEDWCAEYGYDTDNRRAEQTYKIVTKQAAALERTIGDPDEFENLLFNMERL